MAETRTRCPAMVREGQTQIGQQTRHAAMWDAKGLEPQFRQNNPCKSICIHCGAPIVRRHEKSSQWFTDTRVVTHEAASEARAETDRPGGFYARLEAAEAENASLRARLATAEAALADRDRHFLWDDRLRMEREIGDLATRLATAEAERDRRTALLRRFVAAYWDKDGNFSPIIDDTTEDLLTTLGAPSTGTTPPEGT